jgi:hypothetical protein
VIALYHRAVAHDQGHSLDQRTWNDLDLDAVFAALDRTHSPLGQQVLYHRLRTVPQSAHLPAFEALVTRMSDDPEARERTQVALARLSDAATSDLWWLTQPGVLDSRPWWYIAFPILSPVVPVALALVPVIPIDAGGVAFLGVLANIGLRYATAPRLGPLLQPLRQVGPLLAVAETLSSLLRAEAAPLGESLSADLPRLARLRRMAGWVSRDATRANDVVAALFEYLNLILNLDGNVLYFAAPEVQARGEALLRTIKAVGEVDAALSIASYRAGTAGWTRPRFLPATHQTTLENMRHPLLVAAVPNSLALGPPHGVLITGSNMSGKTTLLRTVGVATVMAQTVNTCLATTYAAPVFRVRSVIGRSDDLIAGKSYYKDEVEAVLDLVDASAQETLHLFLFDELFRGTSAIERIACAEATLIELVKNDENRPKSHVVIVATHDRELVGLLQDTYTPYHFTDTVVPDGLAFDYHLHDGPALTHNAIALLGIHGAPKRLVENASIRALELSRERDPSGQ